MMMTVPLVNNFYRDQYQKLFLSLILTLVFGIVSVGFMLFLIFDRPDPVLFSAAYHNDQHLAPAISKFSIVPLTPVNQANMSNQDLSQWIVNALVKSFSISSQEYEQEIANNKNYFGHDAQQSYLSILNNMVQFDNYTTRQSLVSVLKPLGAPIIDNQGVANNQYLWILKLPVVVRFYGSKDLPDQKMNLSIVIGRTSMATDVYGIKIMSIRATDIQRIRNYTGPKAAYAPS